MKLVLSTAGGDVFPVEVPGEMKVEDLCALGAVEAGLAGPVQLLHNGKLLPASAQSLQEAGVADEDMLLVVPVQAPAQTPPPRPAAPAPGGLSLGIDFGAIKVPKAGSTSGAGGSRVHTLQSTSRRSTPADEDPARVFEMIKSDPALLARLKEGNPPLAKAFESGNAAEFAKVVEAQVKEKREAEMKRIRLLADPMNPEAQRLIEEEIAAANIDHNMSNAMEHAPEVFGSVVMLYIDCKVNGHHIKAFVDSGAQSTIMSAACAERCGLFRLLDKRFSGIAKGVGTQKILGRVHMAQLEIGGTFLSSSFTILQDQPMEMLLGLDMLKRHQCCVDLRGNCLRIGTTETSTPFLSEADLPAHARLNGAAEAEEAAQEDAALSKALSASAQGPSAPSAPSAMDASGTSGEAGAAEKLAQMGFDPADAQRELSAHGGDFHKALAALTNAHN